MANLLIPIWYFCFFLNCFCLILGHRYKSFITISLDTNQFGTRIENCEKANHLAKATLSKDLILNDDLSPDQFYGSYLPIWHYQRWLEIHLRTIPSCSNCSRNLISNEREVFFRLFRNADATV